ncbi:MAG TPA: prepilin-type N-terminal cleavage/methylation domain-containing protein [Tepidisphaeraceae bacterium]|nr:prepilin-type N-terminal cleavage/methylation domain-containing protein [Tepidisphaeraceae bacterium]
MTHRLIHAAPRRPGASPPGFTLMELMVSIALVLIVILGVNTVFRITSDTVNQGMALGAASRDHRALITVLNGDLQAGAFDNGPCLIIRSERMAAFRDAVEAQADRDGNAMTLDFDGDNSEGETTVPGETVSLTTLGGRNHRVDRLMFFATSLFRRQTGGGGSYIDDETSTEAYVWMGHVRQPNNRSVNTAQTGGTNAAYYNPGATTAANATGTDKNDNNLHATQWILGRSVILLREMPQGTFPPVKNNYTRETPIGSTPNLTPLSPPSQSADGQRLSWSRYDVAQTSISHFRNKISLYETYSFTDPNQYWWNLLSDERFVAFPYPDRPMTPYGVARTVPVLLPGCTQFAVEYAGDYLNQHPETGAIQGNYYEDGAGGVDGVVDFMVVNDLNAPYAGARTTRRIRWYGMPRNVDTSDDRPGVPMVRGQASDPNLLLDVVPLRDLLAVDGTDVGSDRNFFERDVNTDDPNHLRPAANYAATMPPGQRFVVAWGPNDLVKGSRTKPRMLRVTATVDEPRGRLTEGQTYEYVIDLP